MTEDEKIDEMIGLHVMQWKPSLYQGEFVWSAPLRECNGRLLGRDDWQPTRNIKQAFQAMYKVIALTGYFELYCDEVDVSGVPGIWYCSLEKNPRNGMIAEADAPLAICLACLQAMGEGIEYG